MENELCSVPFYCSLYYVDVDVDVDVVVVDGWERRRDAGFRFSLALFACICIMYTLVSRANWGETSNMGYKCRIDTRRC